MQVWWILSAAAAAAAVAPLSLPSSMAVHEIVQFSALDSLVFLVFLPCHGVSAMNNFTTQSSSSTFQGNVSHFQKAQFLEISCEL
jgi:hypothetical protein